MCVCVCVWKQQNLQSANLANLQNLQTAFSYGGLEQRFGHHHHHHHHLSSAADHNLFAAHAGYARSLAGVGVGVGGCSAAAASAYYAAAEYSPYAVHAAAAASTNGFLPATYDGGMGPFLFLSFFLSFFLSTTLTSHERMLATQAWHNCTAVRERPVRPKILRNTPPRRRPAPRRRRRQLQPHQQVTVADHRYSIIVKMKKKTIKKKKLREDSFVLAMNLASAATLLVGFRRFFL